MADKTFVVIMVKSFQFDADVRPNWVFEFSFFPTVGEKVFSLPETAGGGFFICLFMQKFVTS